MFKQLFLFLILVLIFFSNTILITASDESSVNPVVEVSKGRVPSIDGRISENEWSDAQVIKLSDSAHVYLKYDEANLYIATDSQVGNFFFIIDNKMYVIHASGALGMAVYEYDEKYKLWGCTKNYLWEMRRGQIRNKSKDELQNIINQYMMENGWVASTAFMASEKHNEMVISLSRLGINPIAGEQEKRKEVFPIMISHETIHWPIRDEVTPQIDGLIHGYSPDIIELDYSNWGKIILN